MDKLSIGEKAKRYDEAIEQLRTMMPNWENLSYNGKTFLQDLVHILPELKESKESKDERIRKELIDYFKENNAALAFRGISNERVIAWLEKQGENASDKIVEKSRTEKQRVLLTETDGIAGIDWNCRSLDDVKILLKCGLEFIRTVEANKQRLTDNRFGGCEFRVPTRYDKFEKQGEQKPALNKEDEEAINLACSILYSNFNENENFDKNQICIGSIIEKLKSLKERYTWKPSEEQMKALQESIGIVGELTIKGEYLKELFEDLRKLREG